MKKKTDNLLSFFMSCNLKPNSKKFKSKNTMKFKRIIFQIKLIFFIKKRNLSFSDTERYSLLERKNRIQPISFRKKNLYMKSAEWQTMQKLWLHNKGYRCQMFPFLVLGQHKPKRGWWNDSLYGKFAVHHIDKNAYEQLGMEQLDKNVIVLSKFAHNWVYHYLLSFGKRKVSDQKLVKFANPLQKIMNYWCFLNKWIKLILALIIIYILL